MPTFDATVAGYHNLWQQMDYAHPGMSRAAVCDQVDWIINRGLNGRPQYEAVQVKTGVPWYWILAIHYRESNFNFGTHLHNGDSLSGYTHHVPAGRPQVGHGPPFTWEESAIDALNMRGLNTIKDWSIERDLFEGEGYNGWGYFGRLSTPYLWAWTSLYRGGKVLRDHGPIEAVYDAQCGVAAILKRMADRGLIKVPAALVSAIIKMGSLPGQADRPFRYSGVITLDGQDYPYATGGLNRGSAPYGMWQITPDAIGSIGQRLGAIGIADGEIDDPKYPGAPREGIEIHPGDTDIAANLRSEGCIVLRQSQYPDFKKRLLAKIQTEGVQFITINPDGHITIGPQTQPQPQSETPSVATTTTTPAIPQLNLASIESMLEMVNPFLPLVSGVFPQAPAVILTLESLLKGAAAVQGGQNVFTVLPQILRDAATQLEGIAPKPATGAPQTAAG